MVATVLSLQHKKILMDFSLEVLHWRYMVSSTISWLRNSANHLYLQVDLVEVQGPEFATIVNSVTSKKVAAWFFLIVVLAIWEH